MRAARWHARQDIRIEDLPVPVPASDEVLVRVLYCGICGSDLEEYREGPLTVPVTPHPSSGRMAPITLGHEAVGIVEKAAADGSGPAVGTLVVPDVVDGCGRCWWCQRHEPGLCPRLVVRGQHSDGGLAEFMLARGRTCVVVPEGVAPEDAALAEPLSVAVRAVGKIDRPIGVRAAVIGAGTIGQLIAQMLLRVAGAGSVVVVDPSPTRRRMAAHLSGAEVDPPDQAATRLAEMPEPGVDVIFECTGRPRQLALALERVRPGGLVVAVGLRPGSEAIGVGDLVLGERRVVGTAAHVWDTDVADAIRFIADGRVTVRELVSHRVPLADLVAVGLPALESPTSGALKVLIDCGA